MRAIFLFFTLLGAFSCTSDSHYYCDRPPGATHWTVSQMATVSGKAPHRSMSKDFESWELYRSYDDGKEIISVYKNSIDSSWSRYRIYKLDFSSTPTRFWQGYGDHFTPRQFEEIYNVPFEKKHIVDPRLVKYLPPKKEEGQVSRAYFDKRVTQNCESMGTVEYGVVFFIRFLTQFMPRA